MAEIENHTIALLREIRADIAALKSELNDRIDKVEERLNGRLDHMSKRLDAMHLNGTKALKGFIGHRSMMERAVASIDDQFTRLEARVDALERRA